jgi:hypothetical protein
MVTWCEVPKDLVPFVEESNWEVVPSTGGKFAVVDNGIQCTIAICDTLNEAEEFVKNWDKFATSDD